MYNDVIFSLLSINIYDEIHHFLTIIYENFITFKTNGAYRSRNSIYSWISDKILNTKLEELGSDKIH